MRTFPLLALTSLSTLVACGKGGGIDEEEAQLVFNSMLTVSTSVQTEAASQAPAGKTWEFTEDGDGYSFTGSIEGTAGWTGTVNLTGSMLYTDSSYDYSMDMEYVDVAVGGVTLNGDVAMDMLMDYADDGSFSYVYSYVGQMDATGEAEGTADFDYTVDMTYDAATGAYTYTMTGDISGHDVSGFSAGGTTGGYGY